MLSASVCQEIWYAVVAHVYFNVKVLNIKFITCLHLLIISIKSTSVLLFFSIKMDARDLFRRLSAGAKFDTNRFKNDAVKFQVPFYLDFMV